MSKRLMRERAAFKDHYLTLQVHPEADAEMIDAAYWHLVRRYNRADPRDPQTKACIDELNEAYSVLRSAARRKEYSRLRDATLGVKALPVAPQVAPGPVPLDVMARQRPKARQGQEAPARRGRGLSLPSGAALRNVGAALASARLRVVGAALAVAGLRSTGAALAVAGLRVVGAALTVAGLAVAGFAGRDAPELVAGLLIAGVLVITFQFWRRVPRLLSLRPPKLPRAPRLSRQPKHEPAQIDTETLRQEAEAIRSRLRAADADAQLHEHHA